MTTTKISRRLSVHLQKGNFHQHFVRSHRVFLRPLLLQVTTIIDHDQDRRCLQFKEALHIMKLKPSLNIKHENLILPTNIRRQRPTRNENQVAAGIPVKLRSPRELQSPWQPINAQESLSRLPLTKTKISQHQQLNLPESITVRLPSSQ